jgi:hypothetical protein
MRECLGILKIGKCLSEEDDGIYWREKKVRMNLIGGCQKK